MKQEIKDKLKKYSNVAIVIGGVLLWLVSFIGVTAYSIYWFNECRSQTSRNEVLETKRASKRERSTFNNGEYSFYQIKNYDTGILASSLDYNDDTLGYQSYFTFYSHPSTDTDTYFTYDLEGDFQAYFNNSQVYVNRLSFVFYHQPSLNRATLTRVYSRYGSDYFDFYASGFPNSSTYNVNYSTLAISSLTRASLGGISEVYLGAVLDFYFNKVFDYENVVKYSFESGSRTLPQYLNSYNRLQYGQIMYSSTDTSTDVLSIPVTFVSNGQLFDHITILLRPCWYYYNSAGQIVDNYAITPTGQSVPYVCAYVLYGYYGSTLSWTYDDEFVGLLKSVNNGVVAMYLGYNGYSFQDDVNPTFWAPNYLLVAGLQVSADYQDIYVADIDNVPFPNSSGTNLKPYNNLSIRNILGTYFNFYGDVAGYNGSYYDVGLGSVFTLLSNAFQSLIPLMAIQIIPGITIGLLVMLPLVVTIILVILKLVKK